MLHSLPSTELTLDDRIGALELTDTKEKARSSDTSYEWNAQTLLGLRANLFNSPGGAFDSFASPVLFFHTPGYVVPTRWPGSEMKPETDRYSTSLDDNNDDLVFEAPDFDVAGDGERGEAELIVSARPKETEVADTSSRSSQKSVAAAKPDYTPELARTSYLKFPPATPANPAYSRVSSFSSLQEQLKIPRSLFLYSTPMSKDETSRKKKPKLSKGSIDIEQITPKAQAKEMARLLKRSVLMVESKDRTMWDDNYDAQSVGNERVQVLDLGEHDSVDKMKEWLEECLG